MKTCQITLFLFHILLNPSKCEDLSVVCFASCEVHSEGKLLQNVANMEWWKPKLLHVGEEISLAAKVFVLDGKGGIMIKSSPEGSFDTDGTRWRCRSSDVQLSAWTELNYDDRDWPVAQLISLNGDCKYLSKNNSKFDCIEGMSEYAGWIWTPAKDGTFYCRLNIQREGKGVNLLVNDDNEGSEWAFLLKIVIISISVLVVLIVVVIIIIILVKISKNKEESEDE